MSISSICQNDVSMVSTRDSIQEAAKLMKAKNVGCVVVVKDVSNDRKPEGMLTDRDIAIKLAADGVNVNTITVGDVMSSAVVTIPRTENIKAVIDTMHIKGVRRAPIVDENNKVCGIITMDDLFMLLAEELNDLKKLVYKQKQLH